MIGQITVEYRKLSGSLAILLAVLAPALPAILALLAIASSDRPMTWQMIYFQFALPIWVTFLMPMAVTAFATLLGQVEYRANGWESMFALPVHKYSIFLAKMFVGISGAIGMMVVMLALTALGAMGGMALSGNVLPDAFPTALLLKKSIMILAASAPLVVIQMWAAFRYANFVIPLAVGITGTLVAIAVAMTNTGKADWFPWVMPYKAMLENQSSSTALLALAAALGLVIAAIANLSRAPLR